MFNWLFWLMLALAVTDWIGSWQNWNRLRWLTKPGTLIVLIVWFSQVGGWRGPLVWFGVGLVFSLLGDVLLHEQAHFFLLGMAAFFLAHVFYIVGFAQNLQPPDWKILLPLVVIIIAFTVFTRKVRAGLRVHGESKMLLPVSGYAAVISVMAAFAVSCLFRPAWGTTPAVLVTLGAILFYISDAVLAYNRFVGPIPASDPIVMVTYHMAQILISVGALLQFA